MLDSAVFVPCNAISEFSAWVPPIRVTRYEKDKYAYYCLKEGMCMLNFCSSSQGVEIENSQLLHVFAGSIRCI